MIFVLRKFYIHSLYICPPYLYTVAAHFTLGNPESHFNSIILT